VTDIELDQILTFKWPMIIRRVMADVNADGFAKGFVRSIAKHGKRKDWRPSQRQERVMRQMLIDYSADREPEPELFERE